MNLILSVSRTTKVGATLHVKLRVRLPVRLRVSAHVLKDGISFSSLSTVEHCQYIADHNPLRP